jgi:hypothetical protein
MKAEKNSLKRLFESQKLGVLATRDPEYPYQSVVAFASTPDLKYLLFATRKVTRKYENLKKRPKVSLFIDNRSNRASDFRDAMGVTALGDACELKGTALRNFSKSFLKKHPYLEGFLSSADCALFSVKIRIYYAVARFEEVVEVRP